MGASGASPLLIPVLHNHPAQLKVNCLRVVSNYETLKHILGLQGSAATFRRPGGKKRQAGPQLELIHPRHFVQLNLIGRVSFVAQMTQALRNVFEDLGLDQYIGSFQDHGFDTWETVQDITEADLYV